MVADMGDFFRMERSGKIIGFDNRDVLHIMRGLLFNFLSMFTTGLIVNLLVTTVAVIITAYMLPGVTVSGFLPALLVAILLAVINTFVRPILLFLTLPINIMTV